MRIIAGTAKGCPLRSPKGRRVRPTSDLVRGAMFDILEAVMEQPPSHVLDLYAGSGALGIEALSRGAAKADFVEQDPRCCAVIQENLARTGFAERGIVHFMNVQRALSTLADCYDLVLLDPPYGDPGLPALLEALATSLLVTQKSVVLVEHSPRQPLAPQYGAFSLTRERRHGDTSIALYRA